MLIRRTKLVATIGPASSSRTVLRELFDAGLDVARVSLAHGTLESQAALVQAIREEADAAGRTVAVLLDLPGPKIRTTGFASAVQIERGDTVTLLAGTEQLSTASTFVIDYPTLCDDLEVGDVVSIGDGAVQLLVERAGAASLSARVLHGGSLVGRKGVHIPAARLRGSVPTENDRDLLAAFRDIPVDIVAVSFVRSAADMDNVRQVLESHRVRAHRTAASLPSTPWLMAKIETAQAVENLADIIQASDAVMVARGDLGNEMPMEDVPHLQKRIIRETVRSGKPVLVATQMLESMVDAPSPTRAEATDVANAVLDHASAVMLSAETAIGRHPALVVRTMDRIVRRAERELDPARLQTFAFENRDFSDVNLATAHAGWQAAGDLSATAILCCTRTGATARKMASLRPLAPLYALSTDHGALRRLSLCWGVQPLLLPPHTATSTEAIFEHAIATARRAGVASSGDIVVVVAGSPQAGPGHTDSIRVATVE